MTSYRFFKMAVIESEIYFRFRFWWRYSFRHRQRKAEEAVVYVLHAARSWAQLRASPADKPQSEQIWCSQVIEDSPVICASLGRVELHLGRRMPRAGLLWPVHYLAYAQRGRTVRDGAGEQLTGYSADPFWCKPQHSWWSRTTWCPESFFDSADERIPVSSSPISSASTFRRHTEVLRECSCISWRDLDAAAGLEMVIYDINWNVFFKFD